jgi:2-oxoglutarate/2-oxoacid ferredoxin oxidoreductase subunit beta
MHTLPREHLRNTRLPHIWCPGCGNGLVTASLLRSIEELQLDPTKIAIVSGIGCSSRAAGYLNFPTLHTTHGRALSFATGLKLARPELTVFVIMGDGDSTAIGGNHLIHTCRRNIDLNAIIFNNNIYGMTGGQASPLTPQWKKATTAPFGNPERNFDIMKLAAAAGATYTARATVFHLRLMDKIIVESVKNKGFSVVEAMTCCPISYGRRNKMKDAKAMLDWYKVNAVPVEKFGSIPAEERGEKFSIGIHYNEAAPEFIEEYERLTGQRKDREV